MVMLGIQISEMNRELRNVPTNIENNPRPIEDITADKKEIEKRFKSRIDNSCKCIEIIRGEFDFIEEYLRDGEGSKINLMVSKMNELLLGPQFVEGTKLMKESNGEFATGVIAQKKTTDPDRVLL